MRRAILIFIALGVVAVVAVLAVRLGGLLPLERKPVGTPPPPETVSVVARGLEIPWEVAFAPDGRIFVTERPGRVRIIKDGQLLERPAIAIDVPGNGEGGLQGLALDPNFADNRQVYLYASYRAVGGVRNRIIRYRELGDQLSEPKVLLENIPGNTNHNGGRLAFGPDGKLYATTGDSQDPSSAQDKNSLAGKILRLNSDGTAPDDNPFRQPDRPNQTNQGQASQETAASNFVWSYGHRNPQGLAWDGDQLFLTEHGPSGDLGLCCRDELNRIERGGNYGWPQITGDQRRDGLISPLAESGASGTWAPAGLAVGKDGKLYFAALRGQHLHRFGTDGEDGEELFAGQFGRLRAVVRGPDGALYVTTSNRDGRGEPRDGDDKILRINL